MSLGTAGVIFSGILQMDLKEAQDEAELDI